MEIHPLPFNIIIFQKNKNLLISHIHFFLSFKEINKVKRLKMFTFYFIYLISKFQNQLILYVHIYQIKYFMILNLYKLYFYYVNIQFLIIFRLHKFFK